jgi:hypothetical protein
MGLQLATQPKISKLSSITRLTGCGARVTGLLPQSKARKARQRYEKVIKRLQDAAGQAQ